MASSSFDGKLSTWEEYQNTPWGRLKYHLAQAYLERHLPDTREPLRSLDVGGGNGLEAIAYAKQGHKVALVDLSADLLASARHNAQVSGVIEKLSFHQADLVNVATLFPGIEFDVVLCHNVIDFVDDAGSALQIICQPLRRGGLLSILSVNRHSEPYCEALFRQNPKTARGKLDAQTARSGVFDATRQLRTASEMIELLPQSGCSLLAQYGVRCVNDYIPNNDLKSDPEFFAQLEQLELAMGIRYPFYLVARFFQIIARKTGAVEVVS
jgi:S-adenosylmethionine-dependent methyltransferase